MLRENMLFFNYMYFCLLAYHESQQGRVRKGIEDGQLSTTEKNQEQSLQRSRDTRWRSHYKNP